MTPPLSTVVPGRRAWHWGGLLLVSGLSSPGAAWAQAGGGYPSLPPAGVDVRTGDLRQQLQSYEASPLLRSTQPEWIVSPSIGVDVGVTDNAYQVQSPRRADFITIISPSLVVSGETPRLKLNFAYSPLVQIYASNSQQTRVDQFFQGSALGVIVPETLFLDLRGAITQQSRTGGFNYTSSDRLNRNDQVQTITVSATPYAQHRFGGWGTGRVGYSILRTLQDPRTNSTNYNFGQSNVQNAFGQNLNNQFYSTNGNLTTQRERATFVTGENLGRFNNFTLVEAVQYSGAGAYHNAHRNLFSNDVGYAVTRTITVVAGAGYQELQFNGVPGYRISEPIWNVGVRLTPNADSSISVGYGRRDGANSLYLDGTYAPTARTRIYSRYSQGVTTDSEDLQNQLLSTSVGSTGLLTDSATGAPVGNTNGFAGTQNGLFRLRRFSVGASLLLNRDAFSASVVNEERSNITATTLGPANNNAPVFVLPAGSSSNGTFGTVSWQHELTPQLTSTASISYGVTDYSNVGGGGGYSTRSISGLAALSYQFTQTLSGSARYSYTERSSSQGQTLFGSQGSVTENLLLVGLRKSF